MSERVSPVTMRANVQAQRKHNGNARLAKNLPDKHHPFSMCVLPVIASQYQRDPQPQRFASLTMVVEGRGRPGTEVIDPLISSVQSKWTFLITHAPARG